MGIITLEINSFSGYNRFLSNFYISPVVYDNVKYPSSEHAYQAAKTTDLDYKEAIRKAATPAKAKQIGSCAPLIDNWINVRNEVMYEILVSKFADPELQNKLKQTYAYTLYEGNTWGDTYWGVDLNKQGCNWLGRQLMLLRHNLLERVPPWTYYYFFL